MCIAQGRNSDDGLSTASPLARPPPRLERRSALFLDVDGTPDRDRRPFRPGSGAARIAGAARRFGRTARRRDGADQRPPLAELDRLFLPWRGAAAGVHGSERRRADGTLHHHIDEAAAAALERIRPRLAALAHAGSGLLLEDKRSSLALHYRAGARARRGNPRCCPRCSRREAGTALRLIAGKMVVELQPRGADKGAADRCLSRRAGRFSAAIRYLSATMRPTRTVLPKSTGAAASAIRVGPPAETPGGLRLALGRSGARLACRNAPPGLKINPLREHLLPLPAFGRETASGAKKWRRAIRLTSGASRADLHSWGAEPFANSLRERGVRAANRRLVVVSNRVAAESGKPDSGGLAVAIRAALQTQRRHLARLERTSQRNSR